MAKTQTVTVEVDLDLSETARRLRAAADALDPGHMAATVKVLELMETALNIACHDFWIANGDREPDESKRYYLAKAKKAKVTT